MASDKTSYQNKHNMHYCHHLQTSDMFLGRAKPNTG